MSLINLNDTTPAAPAGSVNVKWQADTTTPARNVSAYLQNVGGVLSKSSTYTAALADAGKLIVFTATGTLNLPAAGPNAFWWIAVQNIGAGTVTLSPNGRTLDGAAGSLSIPPNQGVDVYTDGSNYFTERGMGGAGGTVVVEHNGVTVGTRGTINIIDSLSVVATVTDNSGSNRVDISFTATGGGIGPITFLSGVAQGSVNTNNVTTATIDTTGATLLVAVVSSYTAGGAGTFTDSKSNTWIPLTAISGTVHEQIFYCIGGSVGTGHSFTNTGSGNYPSVAVAAFSGVVAFDVANAGTAGSGLSSIQPGSITPSAANSLIICGLSGFPLTGGFTGVAINLGFTAIVAPYNATLSLAGGIGYFIQGAAAAVNPTWSWTGSNGAAASNSATFK